jgi:methyltransferase (TIGR00027 family)
MKIGAGFAGVGTSTARAVEMYYPKDQRLIDDPIAYKLLPLGWRLLVRLLFLPGIRNIVLALRERSMPGSLGGFLCRGRNIDDVLQKSLATGLDQVVILGAGFDSRAYRIAGFEQVQVFEVDLPGARNPKQRRGEKVLGAVPQDVTLVGMNFEQQKLDEVLTVAGFQTGQRTLFIWEGVTQYLSAEAVNDTLKFISQESGAGSALVFSWVRRGIIDGTDRPEWLKRFLPLASKLGSPWLFSLEVDELEQFLVNHGFELLEDVGAAEYQELYLKQIDRMLNVFEGERVAFARVMPPTAT